MLIGISGPMLHLFIICETIPNYYKSICYTSTLLSTSQFRMRFKWSTLNGYHRPRVFSYTMSLWIHTRLVGKNLLCVDISRNRDRVNSNQGQEGTRYRMLPDHYTSYPDSVSPRQVFTDVVTFLVLLLDDSVSLIYHFNYFDERKAKIYVLVFLTSAKS